jgi:hypothetical protein
MPGTRTRGGIAFTERSAHLVAVAPGGEAPWHLAVDAPWQQRRQPEIRTRLLAGLQQLRSRLSGRRPGLWVCLPARAGSLHRLWLPAVRRRWLAPPAAVPLERLTPLPPTEVVHHLRRLQGNAQDPAPAQVTILPRREAEWTAALLAEAGLRLRGLDLAPGYAALAARTLLGESSRSLFLLLLPGAALWAWRQDGRLGPVGHTRARPGEKAPDLALRAAQEAIQAAEPHGPVQVVLAGEEAAAASQTLSPAGAELELSLHLCTREELTPAGLPWEAWPLGAFLAQGRRTALFDLRPPEVAASWLDRPATTRRLAWAAALLAVVLAAGNLGGAWYTLDRARRGLEQSKAELTAVRGQVRQIKARLARLGPLAAAERSRREAGRLLELVTARLPQGAWLERMEYRDRRLVLYLAGLSKGQAEALFPPSGPLRPASPAKAVSTPWAPKGTLRLVLTVEPMMTVGPAGGRP